MNLWKLWQLWPPNSCVLLIFVEHVRGHQIPDLLVLADCFLRGDAPRGSDNQHGKAVCPARHIQPKQKKPYRGIQGWEYLDGLTYQHLWMSDNVHGYLWMHRKKLVSTVTNPARFPWNLVLFHVIHRQLVLPHILLQLPEGRLGANRILPSKAPYPVII